MHRGVIMVKPENRILTELAEEFRFERQVLSVTLWGAHKQGTFHCTEKANLSVL